MKIEEETQKLGKRRGEERRATDARRQGRRRKEGEPEDTSCGQEM